MFTEKDREVLTLADRRPRVVKSVLAFVTVLPVLLLIGAVADIVSSIKFAELVNLGFRDVLALRAETEILHTGPELEAIMRLERALGKTMSAGAFAIMAAVIWLQHLRARRIVQVLRESGVWGA